MIIYPWTSCDDQLSWLAATLIEENNCGISIKPDDPIAFANTLESITGNEQKLSIMGQNARSLAENHFNRETLVRTGLHGLLISIINCIIPKK